MSDRNVVATITETTSGKIKCHRLGARTTLGRSLDNHIQLSENAVSSHHAVISAQPGGGFMLEDLDTTNGSFIGSEKVKRYYLRDGDVITLGGVEIRFSLAIDNDPITERRTRVKTPRSGLHSIQMRVSEEITSVQPTWELETSAESTLFEHRPVEVSGALQRDYDRLLAAYELIHSILGADDLDEILNRIINAVIDLMSADRAAILLVSPEGRLEPKVALEKGEEGGEFHVSNSILSYVVKHRSAVVCNDLGSDQRFSASKSIVMQNVRSAMCVPMMHDDQLVGILHMDSRIGNCSFEESDLEVIGTIASTAAFCVKTAMLKNTIATMQKRQAETMRAMISGASHFINNPLAVIRSNVTMFEEWAEDITKFHQGIAADPSQMDSLRTQHGIDFIDEELGVMATETGSSVNRIASIVEALHMFDHDPGASDVSELDVSELLNEVLDEQEVAIRNVAVLHRQLEPVMVSGVRDRLRQLFTNLLQNAQEAIEGAAAENVILVCCSLRGKRVIVTIDDSGRGVPPENRMRIFAPFDTHQLEGALGLGLAVAAEIARQHGAKIQVSTRQGGGTRFLIEFPLVGSRESGS